MKTKQLLTLVLTSSAIAVTTFSGVYVTAHADTYQASWGTSADNLTSTGSFGFALAAAESDKSIKYVKLNSDVYGIDNGYKYGYYIKGGEFTLDLNGYEITSDTYTLTISNSETVVTFDDTSDGGKGIISTNSDAASAVLVEKSSEVVVNGGNYYGYKEPYSDSFIVHSEGTLTINDGYFESGAGISIQYDEDYDAKPARLIVNGGHFKSTSWYSAIASAGDTKINGGTFETNEEYGEAFVNYYGGTLDFSGYEDMPDGFSFSAVFWDGVKQDAITIPDKYKLYDIYNYPVSEFYQDGSYLIYSENNVPQIKREVKWGTSAENLTESGPLGKALYECYYDSSIKYVQLQEDISGSNYYIENSEFTLDLNGHSINALGNGFIVGYTAVATITDTDENKGGSITTQRENFFPIFVHNGGKVIIQDGTYTGNTVIAAVTSDATVEINGGTFKSTGDFTAVNAGKLLINGGTFYAGAKDVIYSIHDMYSVENTSPAVTTITGGDFKTAGLHGHIELGYNNSIVDVSKYSKADGIIFSNQTTDDINITEDVIKLPKAYALYDSSKTEVDKFSPLSTANTELYTVGKKNYIAEKITVDGMENAQTNADAVGYYVTNVPSANDFKWTVTMADNTQYQSNVELGTTFTGNGNVSFGIILYGTIDTYGTSDIESVSVSR